MTVKHPSSARNVGKLAAAADEPEKAEEPNIRAAGTTEVLNMCRMLSTVFAAAAPIRRRPCAADLPELSLWC
jgi:hypothetical protein